MNKLIMLLLPLILTACITIGDNSAYVKAELSKNFYKSLKNEESCSFQISIAESSFVIYKEKLKQQFEANISVSPKDIQYKFNIICGSKEAKVHYETEIIVGKSNLTADIGIINASLTD
ncbi:hypothetical protein FGD67_09125 [Colwellia sp. M166]|nr:hypothetical protein FGD67_09125 [Colwellia sp. M166]|tara:strand:+ start:209 stop:565 length:357 start_codon:yes stop_codon:yes gene_type:complete